MSFENLEIEQYLIAGGNQTALVRGCQPENHRILSKELIGAGAEQVGFVKDRDKNSRMRSLDQLIMMGEELSVNACLAMARSTNKAQKSSGNIGRFTINNQAVAWRDFPEGPNIDLSLCFSVFEKAGIDGKIVLLDGIGYRVTSDSKSLSKKQLQDLCAEFKRPAFGDIQQQMNRITPRVYVVLTDTLIMETACGSGSIAAVLAAENEVERRQLRTLEQPTGQFINVSGPEGGKMASNFTISAPVERVL